VRPFVSKYQPQQRTALLRELPFAVFLGVLSMPFGLKIFAIHQTGKKDATKIHFNKRAGT
jgi:hypothetical protein